MEEESDNDAQSSYIRPEELQRAQEVIRMLSTIPLSGNASDRESRNSRSGGPGSSTSRARAHVGVPSSSHVHSHRPTTSQAVTPAGTETSMAAAARLPGRARTAADPGMLSGGTGRTAVAELSRPVAASARVLDGARTAATPGMLPGGTGRTPVAGTSRPVAAAARVPGDVGNTTAVTHGTLSGGTGRTEVAGMSKAYQGEHSLPSI